MYRAIHTLQRAGIAAVLDFEQCHPLIEGTQLTAFQFTKNDEICTSAGYWLKDDALLIVTTSASIAGTAC